MNLDPFPGDNKFVFFLSNLDEIQCLLMISCDRFEAVFWEIHFTQKLPEKFSSPDRMTVEHTEGFTQSGTSFQNNYRMSEQERSCLLIIIKKKKKK